MPDLYCEHCGAGPDCSVCGRGCAPATYSPWVRWGIRRDMPRVLLIERETGGAWSEDDFLFHLAERNKILIVAEGPAGEVTGFAVYHLQEYAIAVLDMAALDPAARAAILAKLAYKGEQHRRPLVWSDGAPF